MPIILIGPGGAGKSTAGARLAERLRATFVDLDQCFRARAGDISEYIQRFGYDAYARENIETYCSLAQKTDAHRVVALSSGFMTYRLDIHAAYADIRTAIEDNPTTFVLIPSLDLERCVAETVRRQCARPFARAAEREDAVIRERFPLYLGLRARKVETMRLLDDVAGELMIAIGNADATYV